MSGEGRQHDQQSGNTEEDWRIFEILCQDNIEPVVTVSDHHHHSTTSLDVVTTLRSELAALSYKRDRLVAELGDAKNALCSRESECESLRAQAARQSALIGSLQSRLQAAENREHSVQSRCDTTIQTIQREKRSADERNKELLAKVQHLEASLTSEETQREQVRGQLQDLVRRLCACFGMDACELVHLSPECVVGRAEEIMAELQRTRAKVASTCDTLSSCENELHNVKSLSNVEKQRLSAQLEASHNHNHELENRCRQYERDLQICRDRFAESEMNAEKLKEELRGFESRCHRLQNSVDRSQSDRLQFLRSVASQLGIAEPCETLIKDKIREVLSENQSMHTQLHSLRGQLSNANDKLKEHQESSQCRIRAEESNKCALEERLEKCQTEIHNLRKDHMALSEYLLRLADALSFGECSSPPPLGPETNIMAENILAQVERLAAHYDHHKHGHTRQRSPEKSCFDVQNHHHHHHHQVGHPVQTKTTRLRRERSCHEIPIKETYTLQRRVRVLREQVQRRDLHLELLRRKLAIIEDGAKGKCLLQGERDDAVCRLKKANKQIDKLTTQLVDARAQLAELQEKLAEAVECKIISLERARKIDELTSQICDLEETKTRLMAQLSALKERLKSTSESSQNRRCRDETLISSLREDISRMQTQLSDANQRLSHLQSFRTSVARTLHLRDLPETDLLHRLQALCSAHQEFTLLSRRYESASPIGDHACPRYDDPVPPSSHCLPPLHRPASPSLHHHLTSSAGHTGYHHHQEDRHSHQKHNSKSRSGSKHRRGGGIEGELSSGDDNHHLRYCSGGGNDEYSLFDDDFSFKGKY